MKTEVLSQEKNIISLKVDFDTEEVNKGIDKTIKHLSQKANIKGFRKGRVPRKTIELYFGKQGICAETMEDLVQQAIEKLIEEYELDLITEPDIKPGELSEGNPFEMEVTFEVTPEVKLPELETIEAERIIYPITDEMLEKNLACILEANSDIVPLYEDRPLEASDYVSVQYTAKVVDGDKEPDVVESDVKTEINLTQENMRPQIVEALVGKKPADVVTIDFPVDESEQIESLAGKTMRYEIEVLGIMEKKVPDLNDDTAAQISQSKFKTAEEFRQNVKEQMEATARRESDESLKASAVNKLCDMAEVEVPQTLIDRQKASLKAEQAERIKRESGMTPEEFFEKNGMDKEAYENEIDTAAQQIVKRSLIIEALADKEDIQWTAEELDAEIHRTAVMSRVEPEKFSKYVYSNRERLFEIAGRIRSRKTIDFLITKVKATEKNAVDAENAAETEEKED